MTQPTIALGQRSYGRAIRNALVDWYRHIGTLDIGLIYLHLHLHPIAV
jgi:hypothetical protein